MARVKDLPCNRCGELMWSGTTSLPEGKARCHACRRIEPQRAMPRLVMCEWCGWMFETKRLKQRFCNHQCEGARRQVRASDDQHMQRWQREKNAPGLGGKARSHLLAQWIKQGKACMYCDASASTIDHVVPLVRGGTNYEGNLVPCCKRCNSSKTYFTVIEWRTGKRLPRMGRALAWQNRVRPAKVVKVKPPKAVHQCLICDTDTTRRLYCSTECGLEGSNRTVRDKYRASVGLPVDFTEPTNRWNADPCPVCGTATPHVYCSAPCRVVATKERQRDRYRAAHGGHVRQWQRAG